MKQHQSDDSFFILVQLGGIPDIPLFDADALVKQVLLHVQ